MNLIGKCGLYCGACTIYRAQRDSKEWQAKLANQFNCKGEEVCCNGCGALTSKCWGNGCKIVICLKEKGLSYCYECSQYQNNQCLKFNDLANDYLSVGVDLRANSTKIAQGEIALFLKESENKFTCTCGQKLSAWQKQCPNCGKNIL